MQPDQKVGLSEVAEQLGVSVHTVRIWVHRGHFVLRPEDGDVSAFKPGASHRLGSASVERLRIMVLLTTAGIAVATAGMIASAEDPEGACEPLRRALAQVAPPSAAALQMMESSHAA